MPILTIAREFGAISPIQEMALCRTLKLRFVHKEMLERRFRLLGMDASFMNRFDERKPGVIDSLLNSTDVYWETMQTAILQEAVRDGVAIVGRGANFLLEKLVPCLRLRFVASPEIRADRVARQLRCTKEQAMQRIRKSDRERIGFCYYYYGRKWQDSVSYDLTVNTDEVNLAELKDLFIKLIPSKVRSATNDGLANATQSQMLRYTILIAEKLQVRFLKIDCDNGNVVLHGIVPSKAVATRVEEAVEKMAGVCSVQNQLQTALNDIPARKP